MKTSIIHIGFPGIPIVFMLVFFGLSLSAQPRFRYSGTALKVGKQIWMEENLDVDHFRNGQKIPQAESMDAWRAAYKNETPAWCYPDFKKSNARHGKLYNVYAVNDERGLAPAGWAIPTDYDWDVLVDFLGDELQGGQKLLQIPVVENNKELKRAGSFFNKQPGSMNLDGFWGIGHTTWWSSTPLNETNWSRSISSKGVINRFAPGPWGEGFAVRCLRINTSVTNPIEHVETYQEIDSTHSSVEIGSQVWMDKNLSVKRFRNGDTILFVNNSSDWKNAMERNVPAWCYYDDRPINGNNYGLMYNWYAVNDPRGLAPSGWHIPSLSEWKQLLSQVGGDSTAGCELKSKMLWFSEKPNRELMKIFPAGGRNLYGVFHFGLRFCTAFWTNSESATDEAYCVFFEESCKVKCWDTEKNHGYYVRCVKD